MEIPEIAACTVSILSPLLPKLLHEGKVAAGHMLKAFAEKAGEDGWKKAAGLWSKLTGSFEKHPQLETAVKLAASEPGESAYQAAFRKALEASLHGDKDLAGSLAALLTGFQHEQSAVADNHSKIRNTTLESSGGAGRQIAKATNHSTLDGVKIIERRG